MNEESTPTTERQPAPGRGRLTRDRAGGMLAGVASGLGRHFDVDPVIFRIAFGVSVFFGGFGVLAYLALALFMPDENGDALVKSSKLALGAAIVVVALLLVPAFGWGFWDTGAGWGALWLIVPAAIALGAYAILRDRGGLGSGASILAAIFIAGAAVTGFIVVALFGALVTAFGHGEIGAALVILAGLAIVAGAFARGLRWLIVPALALAVGVGAAAGADLELDGSIGHREYTPLRASDVPEGGYDLGLGRLDVDLRDLDWKRDDVVGLGVDIGMGQATVLVPQNVCVASNVSAKSGSLVVAGERQEGFGVEIDQPAPAGATPRLELDADLQFGELRVLNDDDGELGGSGHDVGDEERAAQRQARAEACAG